MRGLTVHANAEMIDCGVVDARFESYRACLQIIRGVQTEHALGTIQHTGCDKRLCAFSNFLTRLKHKTNLSAERVSVLRQDFRGTQKAGRVRIMTAGVHDACILRTVCTLMRLLNGQRVDIRTQNQHFSVVLCALQRAEHAGYAYARVRNAELVQFLLNALCRAEFLQAQLRVPVKFPTDGYDVVLRFRCGFLYIHDGFSSCLSVFRFDLITQTFQTVECIEQRLVLLGKMQANQVVDRLTEKARSGNRAYADIMRQILAERKIALVAELGNIKQNIVRALRSVWAILRSSRPFRNRSFLCVYLACRSS